MNNASPPTPAPASLASSRSTQHNRPNFAFLVHSMDMLPQNLPPDADNKSLARQKRRRTRFVTFKVNPVFGSLHVGIVSK